MHCRQCGYDLKGLPVGGRCPECGLEVVETLTQLVDPEASRLPRLRDPFGVGNGLVGLAATHLVAAALVILPRAGPPVLAVFWSVGMPIGPLPAPARLLAGLVGLTGLFWLYLLLRTPPDEPSADARRNSRLMVIGQIGWSLMLCVPVLAEHLGVRERFALATLEVLSVPFAIVGLQGLRGILELVGLRSRAYRNAKGGRQSVDALIGAIIAAAIGNLINATGVWQRVVLLETVGMTLFGASTLLLLLGLVYLLVNCWWIRSAIRRPPPRLDEVLRPTA